MYVLFSKSPFFGDTFRISTTVVYCLRDTVSICDSVFSLFKCIDSVFVIPSVWLCVCIICVKSPSWFRSWYRLIALPVWVSFCLYFIVVLVIPLKLFEIRVFRKKCFEVIVFPVVFSWYRFKFSRFVWGFCVDIKVTFSFFDYITVYHC